MTAAQTWEITLIASGQPLFIECGFLARQTIVDGDWNYAFTVPSLRGGGDAA